MVRDSQRSKVYAWETHLGVKYRCEMTLEECTALIAKACKAYGVGMPIVSDGRGARRGNASATRIHLPRPARNLGYVLHETAHTIAQRRRGDRTHGPVFARLLLDLTARYGGIDGREAIRKADEMRVELVPSGRAIERR